MSSVKPGWKQLLSVLASQVGYIVGVPGKVDPEEL